MDGPFNENIVPDSSSSPNKPDVGLTAGLSTGGVVFLLLLIVVAVLLTCKIRKRKNQTGGENVKTDENVLYGLYYNTDGERIDEGNVYAEDRNLYYQT